MKKKRVIIVSTLLSAGIITAAVVVDNMSLLSNFNVIENVKADDNKDENDIDDWMPDENLQEAIASAMGVEVSDLTRKLLGETKIIDWINFENVKDLDGVQNLKGLDKIMVRYIPDKFYLLDEIEDSVKQYKFLDRGTANFDDLISIRSVGSSEMAMQKIVEDDIRINSDQIVIDLTPHLSNASFINIIENEWFIAKIDGIITDYVFEPSNNTVTISNIRDKVNNPNNKATLVIEFDEAINVLNPVTRVIVPVRLTQLFEIVSKPKPGGGSGKPKNKIEPIYTTNIMTDKKAIDTYDAYGQNKKEKTLTKQTTDFVTETKNTVGKTEYYRIGENEWVKTDDVKVFHFNNVVKQTHGDDHKELTQFRNRGKVENRALKSSSSWVTDRYAYFKDDKYHRVATHEWVHDDHVLKYTPIDGVLKVNENVPLYNSQGKVRNRGLMNNSEFITDRTATINDQLMYRVATDEWVPASLVTLK